MLKENYEEVQKKITEACKRAGRNREEVTLIAVSKTKPVEMLSEIYDPVSYTHLDVYKRQTICCCRICSMAMISAI